jgi:hypothetical protein
MSQSGPEPTGEPIDPNATQPARYLPPSYGAAAPYQPQGPASSYPPPRNEPVPAYPPSWPWFAHPVPPRRPGNVVAASVLGFIAANLLLVATLVLILGTVLIVADAGSTGGHGNEIALDGAVNVVIGVLLVTGAVLLTGRRRAGRVLLGVACVLSAAAGVYWAVRVPSMGYVVIPFISLPLVAAALAWTPSSSRWLASAPRRP